MLCGAEMPWAIDADCVSSECVVWCIMYCTYSVTRVASVIPVLRMLTLPDIALEALCNRMAHSLTDWLTACCIPRSGDRANLRIMLRDNEP